MSRQIRIEFPGAIYHITTRGNAGKPIVVSDSDREFLLKEMAIVIDSFDWKCHAFCFMSNHYHLLIETARANLSKGMRQLNGRYAEVFNRRHDTNGHLFQRRYHAVIVEKETYLLELSRYVVLNPVRAGLVEDPGDWPWSSYLATSGRAARPDFLTTDFILSQFASARLKASLEYVEFVLDGIGKTVWDELRGNVLLGSDSFAKRMSGLFETKSVISAIPRLQRLAARPSISEIFHDVDTSRDELIYLAYSEHGYRQGEIAEFLGLGQPRVSQIVREMSNSLIN